jgi:hypothetical protein
LSVLETPHRNRRCWSSHGKMLMLGPVSLGHVSLSFYAVTGAVIHAVLRRLGHAVEDREGLHEEMFALLGAGSIPWRRHGCPTVTSPTGDGGELRAGMGR